ncbi:MAG TPA: histidine kinase [Bryobacteraceae bacterium]|nr:histidine kinase [Bryobacteraceae bacterium]
MGPDRSRSHRLRRYLIGAAAWTAVGLLFALPSLSTHREWRILLGSLAQWWSWGLLTPLIVAVDRRLPVSSKQLPRRVLAHLVLSLFFTGAFIYLVAAIHAALGIGAWGVLLNARLLPSAAAMFLWNWLVYLLIVVGWQAFRYYEQYLTGELRVERLERQFAEARLNALRMQLEPHFLFNALNTISSQVERDPKLARRMIEHLGDLLRASLDSKDKKEVPLAEELASLRHYLAIQQIRFGDHVKVEIRVDQEVKLALVPGLILQPLVENAIRHGISARSSGGTVTICAARAGNRLEIRVLDDGVGLPKEYNPETSPGVGLAVTRQRMVELHPNGASRFAIRNRTGGGTEVEIALPFNLLGVK